MAQRVVKVAVPENGLRSAANGLGLAGAGITALIRAALMIYHGADEDSAARAVKPDLKRKGGYVSALVDDHLIPKDAPVSWAVRVGLFMADGYDRVQAERMAAEGWKPGRPRKADAS